MRDDQTDDHRRDTLPAPAAPRMSGHDVRTVAVITETDPRSVRKELREPGSVRGVSGRRIRRALVELGYRAEQPEQQP
jgi:hypothetical protein